VSITVQELANAANLETRQSFGASPVNLSNATLLSLFTGWVNQVQRDVLHTSIWKAQLTTSDTFTSAPYVAGVSGSPYVLTANNIRNILTVHDLKNRRTIIPYEDLNYPAATSSPPERSGPPRTKFDQTQQTSANYPQYYIFEACIQASDGSITQGLHLLPDPVNSDYAGTIRYFFTRMIDDVSAATDILVVPDDGFDIMVAGVAMHIWEFQHDHQLAALWKTVYDGMKKGL